MVERVGSDLRAAFAGFFEDRTNLLRAVALSIEDDPADHASARIDTIWRELFSTLPGMHAMILFGPDAEVVRMWSDSTHPDVEDDRAYCHQEEACRLAVKTMIADEPLVSTAIPLGQDDHSFLVAQPVRLERNERSHVLVGCCSLMPLTRSLCSFGERFDYVASLIDPAGTVVGASDEAPTDGPVAEGTFKVQHDTWTLRVRANDPVKGRAMFARLAIWGLGVILAISILASYHMLGMKNTELEKQNETIRAQSIATQEANKKLLHANQELDDFSYMVSHDLKEPLRGIEGLTRLLLEEYGDPLDETGREYLAFVRDSGVRMRRLVDDLLKLSRITRRNYPPAVVDFNELVHEVIETLDFAIREKGAKVTVHPDLPSVTCDRVRIAELFQNIVSNGLKFSNGRAANVEIGYEERASDIIFWVRDNGIGIRPRDQERIFQIFQQLHDGSDPEGTGVGLTICKRIVERHGGTIWVDS